MNQGNYSQMSTSLLSMSENLEDSKRYLKNKKNWGVRQQLVLWKEELNLL